MKEIGLIGATSPLGINLISNLIEKNYRISAGYRSESRVPQEFSNHPAIDWTKADLSEKVDWTRLCREEIVWLAHLNQGRYNEQELEHNLEVFRDFLKQIRNYPVKKLVYISSGGAVYGDPVLLPISEDQPRHPLSSYGKTKKVLEDEIYELSRNLSVKTVIIRPGNVYGFEHPDKENKGIIQAFLSSIRHKTPFTLIHKGQTIRDFIHVSDVSRAIISALESDQPDITWNVGTGKGHKSIEILEMIVRLSGFEMPEIVDHENYSSDVAANILSIERITSESGWVPKITVEEGLKSVIDNWLNRQS